MAREKRDGPPAIRGETSVDARGFAFHLRGEIAIARNARPAGCADLDEGEVLHIGGKPLEKALHAPKPLDDSLRVVQAIDSDAKKACLNAQIFQNLGTEFVRGAGVLRD